MMTLEQLVKQTKDFCFVSPMTGIVYVLVEQAKTVPEYWQLSDYYVDRPLATQTLVLKKREPLTDK